MLDLYPILSVKWQ